MLPTLSILTTVLAVAFMAICLFMILVILVQKPKGGGLGSAFGGGGGGGTENAAFGAKTGDVLTWVTVTCFVCFLLLAMGLTWTIRAEVSPQPIIPAQQATSTAPADDATAPADASTAPAEASPAAPNDPTEQQPRQSPVLPAPAQTEPADGMPEEPITEQLLPESPDQPTVPAEAEPLLEEEAGDEQPQSDNGA